MGVPTGCPTEPQTSRPVRRVPGRRGVAHSTGNTDSPRTRTSGGRTDPTGQVHTKGVPKGYTMINRSYQYTQIIVATSLSHLLFSDRQGRLQQQRSCKEDSSLL